MCFGIVDSRFKIFLLLFFYISCTRIFMIYYFKLLYQTKFIYLIFFYDICCHFLTVTNMKIWWCNWDSSLKSVWVFQVSHFILTYPLMGGLISLLQAFLMQFSQIENNQLAGYCLNLNIYLCLFVIDNFRSYTFLI